MKNFICVLFFVNVASAAFAQEPSEDTVSLEEAMIHLRSGETREWSSFPEVASGARIERRFHSEPNPEAYTLSLRQQDVKEAWQVLINEQPLGRLVRDENDMVTDFEIPHGALVQGENKLEVLPHNKDVVDDIRVGEIRIHRMDPPTLRSAATIDVDLFDERGGFMPGRITIVDERGTLVPVIAEPDVETAVRAGVVYTSSGRTSFAVKAGVYKLYAGRGFEYSIASTDIEIMPGQRMRASMKLRREVDTAGWVACDTHMHTLTHSGHGDCTIEERMVTLAGEGVELAIATDHNKHVDFRPSLIAAGLVSEFTPVIGNEVSTEKGHFCIFPIEDDSPIPDFHIHHWEDLFEDIYSTPGVRVAILNHARDIHNGFRPFSPRHHLSLTGENLDGQLQRYNALEVINSGAIKNDVKLLFMDWCGLMNRGLSPTPVGGSDSHDVSRYIVGQGRTYIRCNDTDPASINIDECVDSFLAGRVVVSYGLLATLNVNREANDSDLVTLGQNGLELVVEVHGPQWTEADSVELYICGQRRFSEEVPGESSRSAGKKFRHTWRIAPGELKHDVWVTATATGPGVSAPYWPMAKPYDVDSPDFESRAFSCSGAIRIDADGDGMFSSPAQYADQLIHQHGQDFAAITKALTDHHISVTHQVASKLRASGVDLAEIQQAAEGHVSLALSQYRKAWRDSTIARLEQTD
ncbi:CehA/McbA family metallohydrolase [Rubripirellula amarantea]|nr:CehA/McbA family metallohydrolase [Rubripirellula amarantea]